MLENYQMIESQSALCEVVSYRRTLCITWSINPLKVFLQFAVNYSEYQRKCTEKGQKARLSEKDILLVPCETVSM